jgi:hypothetical protein
MTTLTRPVLTRRRVHGGDKTNHRNAGAELSVAE